MFAYVPNRVPIIYNCWIGFAVAVGTVVYRLRRYRTVPSRGQEIPISYNSTLVLPSVAYPDPGGSGFKSPGWIRIRNPDPGREIEL